MSRDFDYGHIEEGSYKYVNSFFRFEMAVPKGWFVLSEEQKNNVVEKGKQVFDEDKTLKSSIKAALVNSANLLMVFQYERGTPVEFNSSVSVVAENMNNMPGIKTGSDYLFHAKRLLLNASLDIESIDDDFEQETIGGVDFYKMRVVTNVLQMKVNQAYYSTVSNGFSLCMIITFVDEKQQHELENTIHGLKFF